jgi:hypothetical protein
MQMSVTPSAIGALESDGDPVARPDVPPDIVSPAYWSGACVCATAWLAFILYAAILGMN